MNDDYVRMLTAEQIIKTDVFDAILSQPNDFERQTAEEQCLIRAKELGCTSSFKKLFKAYKINIISKRSVKKGNKTNFIGQPIELNCGDWICDESGVHKNVVDNRNGDIVIKYASPLPILVVEHLKNIDTEASKVKLAYFRDGWNTLIVNASTIASNTKIIELADYGIVVNSNTAKLLVEYLGDLIALNEDIIPKYDAVSRLGWLGDKFIPYDSEYKFDGEREFKSVFESVKTAGSFKEWLDFTKELRKNIVVRLAIGASLGSVIVERVHALPFIFHMWGETSFGKTVTAMTAASVWGDPNKGAMWRSINNTVNYAMGVSAFFKNMPVIFDELQTIKQAGGSYDKLIMSVTEGINRGRMSYSKMEQTQCWDCAFIFSGEESITKENSGGGAKNRVIEVECTEKIIEDGNKTAEFLRSNYGWAGQMFVQCIKSCTDLSERYNRNFKAIMDSCDTTDKQAMAMAVIMTADEIVCAHPGFYKDEKPLDVSDVRPFLMSTAEVDVTQRAWDYTVNLIAMNASKFSADTFGEIWGRVENDIVYVNKTVLSRELSAVGFEFDAVKRKWAANGRLEKNSQGKMYHQTTINGMKGTYIRLNLSENSVQTAEMPPF